MSEEAVKPMVKLIKPSELLKSAWQIYTDKFWLFIKVFLYTLLGMIPLAISLIIIAIANVVNLPQTVTLAINIVVGIIGFLCLLFGIYYSLRSKAGMYLVCEEKNDATAKEVFNKTKKMAWPFFLASFVSGILVLLWSILLVIPGIMFAIYYAFASLIVVFENKKPWESIKESKQLIKGYWWATFGRLLFIGLIIFVINFIFAFIGELMPEKSIYFSVWNVIMQIVFVVISPIVIAYTYLLYKNLKDVKRV